MKCLLPRAVSVSESENKKNEPGSKNIKSRYLQNADLQQRAHCHKSREA